MIPIFSQRGGHTLASRTPSVTQLNAVSRVAAPWPQSVEGESQARASNGPTIAAIHHRAPRFAQPNEHAARIGTAISASQVSPFAVADACWIAKMTTTIEPSGT